MLTCGFVPEAQEGGNVLELSAGISLGLAEKLEVQKEIFVLICCRIISEVG